MAPASLSSEDLPVAEVFTTSDGVVVKWGEGGATTVTAPLKTFEPLRLSRLKRQMTAAAAAGRIFHLWWHPHNFGADTEANLYFLDRLLDHYRRLRDSFGMRSETMAEAALR